ncbi:anthocyanin 3'-O-beta-glucosyltransferase-like [Carex rostrata]
MERILFIYKPEQNATSDSDPFLVPGIPNLLSKISTLGKEKLTEFFNCVRETENATVGWVVNAFSELESEYIKHFERETGRPVFAVGPVCLSGTSKQDVAERGRGKNLVAESERLLTWLDGRPSFSVVYVCFGSSSMLPKAQLREIGFGLVDSKVLFIWVVGEDHSSDGVADEVAAVAGESGQVIKGWLPQLAILGHIVVGKFVTHCGWGAVTEAVALSRLLLTWPLFGEQFYNEKFVIEVVTTGESMGAKRGVVLSREKVAERVRWAHGTGAEAVRKRARNIGLVVRREVVKGGSSYASVDCMIEEGKRAWFRKSELESESEF